MTTATEPDIRSTVFSIADLADLGIVKDPDRDFPAFRNAFSDWARQFDWSGIVYPLPIKVITSLALPLGQPGVPLFDTASVAAEQAYTTLCDRYHTGGFRDGRPIFGNLFGAHSPLVVVPDPELSWTRSAQAVLDRANPRHLSITTRLKAYVGLLWTTPMYVDEIQILREVWFELDEPDRPPFPFDRLVGGERAPHLPPLTTAGRSFFDRVMAFLDRWSLLKLDWWDLPFPQGPLPVNPFPTGSTCLPSHGVHSFTPTYFGYTEKDELHETISACQVDEVARLGLPRSFAAMGGVKKYATKADIIHLETSIRQRFPVKCRGGLVGHIHRAASEVFSLSENTVESYRRQISGDRNRDTD